MNERIRELAEQAGIMIPKDSEYNGHIYRNTIEKFAELLIEECAKISESVTPRHTECGNRIAGKIRQFHGDKNEMV